jgi:hypothetical protein
MGLPRFDSFVDSLAGRLVETWGDALRQLRQIPNTGETSSDVVRRPDTICLEPLNPKVQGSIPCASTILMCKFVPIRLKQDKAFRLMLVSVSADALQVSRLIPDTPVHEESIGLSLCIEPCDVQQTYKCCEVRLQRRLCCALEDELNALLSHCMRRTCEQP